MELSIIIIFLLGYLAIAFEHPLKINKTAPALITAALCWALFILYPPAHSFTGNPAFQEFSVSAAHSGLDQKDLIEAFIGHELALNLGSTASILFFLLGAMTIVELVDAHQGFRFITDRIQTKDLRKLLWIVCGVTFFLSAVLDNLTTAIVMVSLVRKLIPDQPKRLLFAGMIIIAANAGGAWSPIGDVTTTMLWIGGQISSMMIIKTLFLPSVISLLVPLIILSRKMKGELPADKKDDETHSKGGNTMLVAGMGALLFVPIFKTVTHLPPYIGMLLGLGVLWVISEFINPDLDESERRKYSAAAALSRIDVSSVLFFLGILLAVGALESMQTLHHFAEFLNSTLGDNRIIITLIGIVSAVVDNVPLVAACMGMYSLDTYPMDHMTWEYLAYCAGTGGSLLVIGSAAGVAVMGMEKMDFLWFLKKMTALAFAGYVAGAIAFLLQRSIS